MKSWLVVIGVGLLLALALPYILENAIFTGIKTGRNL